MKRFLLLIAAAMLAGVPSLRADSETGEFINVLGYPEAIGTPDPNYGMYDAVAKGESYTFTCPASYENAEQTLRAQCVGWKLVLTNGTVSVGTDRTKTIVYGDETARAQLTWLWRVECKITATAGEGGSVAPAEQWVRMHDVVKVVATPDKGKDLWAWTGGRRAQRDTMFAEVCTGPTNLMAEFEAVTAVSNGSSLPEAVTTLESAIAAGTKTRGILQLPAGSFELQDGVVINGEVMVKGAGREKTTLYRKGKFDTAVAWRMLYLNNADSCVRDLTLSNGNYSVERAGGVYIGTNGGVLENCRVQKCTEQTWSDSGTAIYAASEKALISRCLVEDNSVTRGYNKNGVGLYLKDGLVENTLFRRNTGTSGSRMKAGGIHLSGTAVARNCTVVGNTVNYYYGGVYCDAKAKAINCAVLDNEAPEDNTVGTPNWGGTEANFINCAVMPKPNDTCYDGEPDFADKVDYRLLASSLLRNAGDMADVSGLGGLDLDGNPRTADGQIDIGCYQYDVSKKSLGLAVTPTAAFAGSAFTFTPSIIGYESESTHSWLLTDKAGNEINVPVEQENSFVIATPGVYTVTLTVVGTEVDTTYTRTDYLYVAPQTIYVNQSAANPVAPYDSWEKATPSLNDAVDCSQKLGGQEVLVTNGTYQLTASLEFSVKTTMRSVEGADKTVIHGKKKRPIRLNHPEAVVKGFAITGGEPSAVGGGVMFDYNGGTLLESIVTNNYSTLHDSQGGGIFLRSDDAYVNRCIIGNNSACRPGSANGGGAYISKGRIENSLFVGNKCNWNGGGVYMSGGKLYNCTFYDNSSAYGKSSGRQGGGIYAAGGEVKNCASYGNTAYDDTSVGAPDVAGTASCFSSCAFPKSFGTMTGIADAGFVDAVGGDFHLLAGSALRDLGEAIADLSDKDLDGNPRRSLDSNPDVGCYEYDKTQKALGFKVLPTVGYENGTFTFVPTIEGYGPSATHFWTIIDQKGNSRSFASTDESSYRVESAGVYDVTLSVVENDVTNSCSLAKVFRAVKKLHTVSTDAELAAALEDAEVAADVEITVKAGTYLLTKTIDLSYNTRLVSEGGASHTVLKRDATAGDFRILNLNNPDAYVQGFAITGGYATDGVTGGGVHITELGGTLVDCVVTNNHANWYDNSGGGIGMKGGLVDRCVIKDNKLDYTLYYVNGGGVHMTGGLLRNSLIVGNEAEKSGGGVYLSGGQMIGCTVYGNTSVKQSGEKWKGGGICVAPNDNDTGSVVNCASYGNTATYDTTAGAPDVAGRYAACTNCAFPKAVGTLKAITDPLFTDAANGDFTLQTGSPLIDAGIACDGLGEKDLAGLERRSRDSLPDIGCHEYEKGQLGIGFTVVPSEGFADTTIVFTSTIDGAEGEVVKKWELIASDGAVTTLPASCETGITIADYDAAYSVRLTVTVGGKDYSLLRERILTIVPKTMYVDIANANPQAPYATRETAATNISDAIDYAIDGATIRVAVGEYKVTNSVELLKDIALVSDEGAAKTTIVRPFGAKEPYFGVVHMHSSKALMKGFTITGGYGDWGGVRIDTRGGTLEDSIIVSNCCRLTQTYQDGAAGGCHSKSASGVWRRCVVKHNVTYWYAPSGILGGIADNCLIAENGIFGTDHANGGGMSVASATNCTVVGNVSCNRTAGLVATVAYNCLMLGNVQTNKQSAAIVSDWEDDVSLRDKYLYCCTSSRTGEGYVISDFANAGFVNAAEGNYHLTRRSPAFKIGSRLNYTADSVDLDGKPRVYCFERSKSRPDAGCYERQQTNLPGLTILLR